MPEEIIDESAEIQPKTKKQQKAEKKALKKQRKLEKRMEKCNKKKLHLLFPANKKGKHVMKRLNFMRIIFYPIHSFFYPFKMYGPHKIGKGACIYVGNHYCIWDVFYPAHTTWEGIHFLAKDSLMYKPVIGRWARKLGVIAANRDGSDVRTLMNAMKVLKNGEKISLFPEGTRNKVSDREFLPFRGGAALLAIKTKTPIVPFVICNRPRVFRRTHVVFGDPITLDEYYDRKLTQEDYDKADEKLKNRLYELREQHEQYLSAKKSKKKKK